MKGMDFQLIIVEDSFMYLKDDQWVAFQKINVHGQVLITVKVEA